MMMRVTNKMLVNELNRNLTNNMLRMDKFQRQLSTTRKINTLRRPSRAGQIPALAHQPYRGRTVPD